MTRSLFSTQSFQNLSNTHSKLNTKNFEIFKKFKPCPGILAYAPLCLILCFFYFDYRPFNPVFRPSTWFGYNDTCGGSNVTRGGWYNGTWGYNVTWGGNQRPGFYEEGGNGCDLFDGDWVWDESNYPLYRSQDCLFMDSGFRCLENGRPDELYTKWRWQPKNCNLPKFDAKNMLEKLKNRRMVFVGDSIGRNQWESLLCMLSSVVLNKTSIYEVNGRPITKHMGFLIFKFEDYNCTVEYYRAPWLVPQGHPPDGSPKFVRTTLKIDEIARSWPKWKDADVLVFNAGHWWNNEKTIKWGCYFQEGGQMKMNMSVESAFRRSMETLVNFIGKELNLNKTQVLFRSYAPVHFRDGDWNTGGSCHKETLPELVSSPVPPHLTWYFQTTIDVLSKNPIGKKLDLLNITYMSSWRKDGHASLYYLNPSEGKVPLYRQDCSHWCLPGVPDSWNELLYAVFLKREITRSKIYAQAPMSQ